MKINKTDSKHFKWGIFYFNPDDSRIIVPKKIPWMGWTLNFANLYSYLLILGIIVLVYLIKNVL